MTGDAALPTAFEREAFFAGVRSGDVGAVSAFLEAFPTAVEVLDREGQTALIWASMLGQGDIIKALLESSADINRKGLRGDTALIVAASRGRPNVVELLLSHGADANLKNVKGMTALMLAGNKETAELLLGHGAEIDLTDNRGFTALMHAARDMYGDVLCLLLESGADTEKKGEGGYTAHGHARLHGEYGALEILEKWEEKRAQAEKERALARDVADFSPALKRDMVYKGPLRMVPKL